MTAVALNNSSDFASYSGVGGTNAEEANDFRNFQSVVAGPGPSTAANVFQQPFYMKPAFRFKTVPARQEDLMQDGPGRRLRKNVANVRKHIDYIANVLNHIDGRLWQHSRRERPALQPDTLYQQFVLPPSSTPDVPVDCVLSKFVRSATNKVKCPVYALCWTPEGKRLVTGASSGEFTLWNGTAFNFETILQAHDVAVRALKWSHNDQWMASADNDGFVKYWQPNMNNVHMFQAHKDEPIRSLSFSPTDVKLATGSDDATARIWDFARCVEERVLRGHGADVRSVDWHPTKGLVATGSRDSQQPVKLWDPKTGQCLATLHDHKNSVMAVQWNRNGNWLLTGSRDHLIKLYDIRMMKEMQTFRAHKKEVTALAWHPIHEGLFVSGGGDGSLGYWLVNTEKEMALLEQAHDQAIWTLDWHPLGHILATGSNDNNTKFWTRNRPGDTQEDVFGLATTVGTGGLLTGLSSATTTIDKHNDTTATEDSIRSVEAPVIPGLGLDEEIYGEINRDVSTIPSLPGLGGVFDETIKGQIGAKKTLIKQPPPKRAQRQFERMWMVSRPGGGNEMDDGPDFEEGNFFSMPSIGPTGHATANGGVTNVGSANLAQRQPKSSLLGAPPPPNPSLLSKPKSMVPPPSGTPGQPPSSTLSQSGEGISDMDGMSMMDNQSTSIPSSSMKSSMLPPPMMKPPMAMQPMQDTWLASDNPINHNKVWRAPHSQQHLHDPRMAMNQNMRHQMPPGFHPPPQNCPTGSMMRPPRPVWGEDWQRGRNFQQHQPPPQFAGGKYPPNSQFRRKMHNGKPYN